MAEYVQVATATEYRDEAVKLAQSVVAARLAAGAQIVGPVASVFWHDGEFGTGEEWQLVLKTRADRYAELEAHLMEHHPWKSPEVSAVPLTGSAGYLRWIDRTTQPDAKD
ncbi:divalent-cation tolerance protein CutA [Streptomyces sp. N2-109]|uniref:Divalent-cation tolerance protein CutA n=1 Tax=Streptomyces gossypii TaxID=2883101 RepID=A0ABT2JYS7_9ACTN|nr:divalent-cation tolerance protein CutA [Streptomyces gossypii]MCT2592841.1 divalent-cation tolerance protein CutA [Streptomyces gossypii]